MQLRSLGQTGLRVSRLGLGTMTWGRDTDEHEARDQLIAFAEAGGTLLDTAASYGDGAAEELIGSLIGDVVSRDEIVLATKAGLVRRGDSRRVRHLPRSPAARAGPLAQAAWAWTTWTCGRCTCGATGRRSRRPCRRSTWR